MRHYEVAPEQAGIRLDKYLAQILPEFTRSFLRKMIRDGSVFIDQKKTTKAGGRMQAGQKIVVIVPSIKEIGIKPESISLDILYEDDDLIAINKPAGMVVHPTDRGAHVSGTLVNAVMHHCPHLSGIGGERRPGIVHRLDKDTSGVILVAKSDKAHHFLAKQWESREIIKQYTALLKGHLKPTKGSIEAPLLEMPGAGTDVKISNRTDAKYALTHYEVEQYVGDYTLVDIQIITGRTHQIRVHFASIGYPVCGDTMYGDAATNESLREKGLARQFLHARSLTFRLPKNNERITLEAPLPRDLKKVLKALT